MKTKKTIYLSGPITGVAKYWEAFEKVEDQVTGLGHIVLSPTRLPEGMTNEQYMRICFAMIDSADAVLFLPGSEGSDGAMLEYSHCRYIDKPFTVLADCGPLGNPYPEKVAHAWLEHQLEEVLKGRILEGGTNG